MQSSHFEVAQRCRWESANSKGASSTDYHGSALCMTRTEQQALEKVAREQPNKVFLTFATQNHMTDGPLLQLRYLLFAKSSCTTLFMPAAQQHNQKASEVPSYLLPESILGLLQAPTRLLQANLQMVIGSRAKQPSTSPIGHSKPDDASTVSTTSTQQPPSPQPIPPPPLPTPCAAGPLSATQGTRLEPDPFCVQAVKECNLGLWDLDLELLKHTVLLPGMVCSGRFGMHR